MYLRHSWFPLGLGKRKSIFRKLYWKIEKNTGKVGEICQPVIVKTLKIWYHTLNKNEKKQCQALRESTEMGHVQSGLG